MTSLGYNNMLPVHIKVDSPNESLISWSYYFLYPSRKLGFVQCMTKQEYLRGLKCSCLTVETEVEKIILPHLLYKMWCCTNQWQIVKSSKEILHGSQEYFRFVKLFFFTKLLPSLPVRQLARCTLKITQLSLNWKV